MTINVDVLPQSASGGKYTAHLILDMLIAPTLYNVINCLTGVGFSSDAALRFAGFSQDFLGAIVVQ